MRMIAPRGELEKRMFLGGVSWTTYQQLRRAVENRNLRMTYDHGALEIVSPSRKHEQISYLVGWMIDVWAISRKIEIGVGRNTTFSRRDLDSGLEPDNCYWITNEKLIRDKGDVDLRVDPPPDLVLEVDVTRSSIPKLPIYAALGVPEVLHWKQGVLEVLRLDEHGKYQPCQGSVELPRFPLAVAAKLVVDRAGKSDTAVIQKFIRAIKPRRRK
jgi:Uma2 family endonuclease